MNIKIKAKKLPLPQLAIHKQCRLFVVVFSSRNSKDQVMMFQSLQCLHTNNKIGILINQNRSV